MHRPLILLLLGALLLRTARAYLHGDAVGILLRTHAPSAGSATIEAYRHQLPRFGVSTTTRFDVASLLEADDARWSEGTNSKEWHKKKAPADEHLRLSLSFDEGFHRLPWLDIYHPRKNRALQRLIVTIVYRGAMEPFTREAKYGDATRKGERRTEGSGGGMPKSFTVEYVWVNEADVDAPAGFFALFVAVLVVSLSGMVGACLSSSDEGSGAYSPIKGRGYKAKHSGPSSSLEVEGGSSDGYAKRL
ncbi:LOW QUALITY PROTEIN: hypothetical protein ACHAXT_003748 [Thalassiosira profunda]